MLNETRVRELLHQAGESIPVEHQSSDELLAESRQARRKRVVAHVVLAAAAVVLVLSGTLVLPRVWDGGRTADSTATGDRRSEQVTTPQVAGLLASEAYQKLRDSGFDVEWTDCSNQSCPAGDSGQVLQQEPKAGTSLEAGSTVTLTVRGYGRDHGDFSPDAALRKDGRLAVTLYGSSSCPERPKTVEATGDNEITVVSSFPRGACYSDFRPFTSIVDLPAGIDVDRPVVVTVVSPGYIVPSTMTARRNWSLPCPPGHRMFIVPGMAGLPTMLAAAHFGRGKE